MKRQKKMRGKGRRARAAMKKWLALTPFPLPPGTKLEDLRFRCSSGVVRMDESYVVRVRVVE